MRSVSAVLARIGRAGIRGIDWILRRYYGVYPFTYEPGCIFRLAWGRSREERQLSDGTRIQPGDPLIHLHLWNERLKDLPQDRTSLAWGRDLVRMGTSSLSMLAAHLSAVERGHSVVALRGESGFLTDLRAAKLIAVPLGFDVVLKELPGLRVWRRAFWDNFYSYLLLWAFGPASMRGKRLASLNRVVIWMSRERLFERYGREPSEAAVAWRTEGGAVP